MHLLSRFGPSATTALLLLATQGVCQSIPSPNLDLGSLGQVTLAGNFDAIQVFSGQQRSQNNGSQSILSQLSNGAFDILASTDASIEALCPLVLQDGSLSGVVVGGNFTSIGGVAARSAALLNTSTLMVEPLAGIQGTVSALYCDQDNGMVYLGGAFEAGNSSNAVAWQNGGWSNLPFAGFDAPVNAITKAPNGHIVFGGSFTGLGNMSTTTSLNNQQTQVINLSTANITSQGSSTQAGVSDPKNVVCPTNSSTTNTTFLLADNTPGSWRADLGFGFQPTKLRLWNVNQDGRGTKTWRFTAHPIDGIMNFTYIDPETGTRAHCDATCPLALNASEPFQDFEFVNLVGMNSFTIDISDWYGDGGGLAGIEIFQGDIFSYAIEAFNEPQCLTDGFRSQATATGPWYTTPSGQSVADYMTVVVGPTTVNSTSIVFEPDVQKSGNYSVIVYTPGCLQDSSCSARAIVNISGTLTSDGGQAFSSLIYQTNNFDKYDQVYQGHIDATTSSFRPSITITPSGLQNDQLIVASRVKFGFISTTGGLNGLFDYNPDSDFVNTDFSQSAINNAGTILNPNAHMSALTTRDDTIYIGGRFSDDTFENIMAFHDNNATSLPGGGLNAAVSALYSLGDFLYVGGNFTNIHQGGADGLNNVAAYQYSKNAWVSLSSGLNGPVEAAVPMTLNISGSSPETVIAFSGTFDQIQGSGSASSARANGLAIWVPSQKAWLANLDIQKQALQGRLYAATFLPNNTWLGAGTINSLGLAISGAAGMRSQSGQVALQQLPIDISSSSSQSNSRKRAITQAQNVSGVTSVAYYDQNGQNVTIFGGQFSATATNGSTIQNLMFLNSSDNSVVTGAPAGLDSNSTIATLAIVDNLLFAGGRISGQFDDTNVQGLVLFDMSTAGYRTVQPASLQGTNVLVNAVVPQSGSSAVYVGGAFDQTSQGLSCPSVCMYDTATSQWNTVGTELDGTVMSLFWTSSSTLLAIGNLTVAGNQTSLAEYNTKKQTWTTTGPSVPGAVTAFCPATDNADHLWIAGTANNGSTFLIEIDGDNTRPVPDPFSSGTTIQGLQIMSLSKRHGSTQYLDNDRALLVTGQLNIPNFGNAAAALFNGTTMEPLILATTSNGDPGSISQVFTSKTNNLKSSNKFGHSKGIAVLVALCAALGTIFLIILIGIILNRIQRRRAGYKTVPSVPYADKNSNIQRVPPEALFGNMGSNPGVPRV
ncbi:hypothetical protein H2202_008343 [Exophiala xenobiotica]|nr:hypothetical protein H2202_008343 [Exophiala xenobiotica]KAK5315304.1 hypothetical protein LTR93_009936 [Exophiala xenobiotica]KAK5363525.1 hypothetical protein LTS13_009159 [Exophiala xenobiotica]KAK5402596.1 hypothetical protein LTR79_001324 [Exophiala xenobiotica]KAK5418352.1 hypothetical protein LTR06_002102 [Exophiala xenobiotica]